MRILVLLAALIVLCGCTTGTPPATVGQVDLQRYAGVWYEIARLPQGFEEGCEGVTATYTLRADGKVAVLNQCHEAGMDGKMRQIEGTARAVDPPANSKLKVMFFWPFEGDYWVFRLNEDYTTAAVGSPDRKSLWILHRAPEMAQEEYAQLVESLAKDGFETSKLHRTLQK